jgi:predicted Zn-dependent peptidase
VWVKVGSRDEPPEKNGLSHFLEHMFFKGTRKRSARQIALEIDSLGGDLNAFTSKENTVFYVKVLGEHLQKALELLADIFCHSTLEPQEIEKEKGVVKEEIKMLQDTPDEYIHDLFSLAVWGPQGLGQPVLGSRASVRGLSRQDLLRHIRRYYGTVDTVVALAGNFRPQEVLGALERHLGGLRRGSEARHQEFPAFRAVVKAEAKDLKEVHLCLGLQGQEQANPRRYELQLLNTILGSGVSSRLFQEIREARGLVYTVYSFVSSYTDTGLWSIYAATSPGRLQEVLELLLKHLSELPRTLTHEELRKAKEQLKGNLLLGLESTSGRMHAIARQEIYLGRYLSPQEVAQAVEAVSLKGLRETAEALITGRRPALVVLGPVDGRQLPRQLPPL